MKKQTTRLALVTLLCAALFAQTACDSDRWLKVAQANIPIVTQMAVNLAALAVNLKTGGQISSEDQAAITRLGDEAGNTAALIGKLLDEYRANPSASVLQRIEAAINTANRNLPALLSALHIKNGELQGRIATAVGLILTTLASFAALMPGASGTRSASATPVTSKQLKSDWNRLVVAPTTSNAAVNAALAGAQIR